MTKNVRDTQGLLPLQLAARLGNHDLVKFLMRKQCTVLWVWGPVSSYSMDLHGIDSAHDDRSVMVTARP